MTILRELITVLGYDVDDAGAKKAEKIFDGLKKGSLAVVAAVGAGVIALEAMIRTTVTAGDVAAKTGKRLGITAEEVQELSFAAERSGVPIAQLNQGLRSLQRRAADAVGQNNEFAKGFRALGVRVTDANGKLKPTVALFEEVATAFQGITDEGKRTAIAMKVAGDGGAALLPLFLEGAKGIEALRQRARVLGFVLDNETAAASERIADNFTDMGLLFTGVSRRISTALLPTVGRLTTRFVDLFIANRELIDRGIRILTDVVEGTIDAIGSFIRIVDENRRFLFILAGVLTAAVLPALLSVAGGYALVAAQAIIAAAVAAAPFLGLALLAGLVAVLIEDVLVFVKGGQSAIGTLFDFFQKEAQKPDAHWMVLTMNAIMQAIVFTIDALNDFFRIWVDQSLIGGGLIEGMLRTLKLAGEGVILFFEDVGDAIVDAIRGAIRRAIGIDIDPKIIARGITDPLLAPGGGRGALKEQLEGLRTIRRLIAGGPLVQPADIPAGPSGGLAVTIEGAKIDVKVEGAGGDPNAIADRVVKKVETVIQEQNKDALRELVGRVKQ